MEDKRAVGAENPDERRNKQGIGQVLSIKKFFARGGLDPPQEYPVWPGAEILVIAEEVFFRIEKVAVESDTLSHDIVNGLVPEKKTPVKLGLMEDGEVDEQGEAEEEEGDDEEGGERALSFL
jgi:hypothetical protein